MRPHVYENPNSRTFRVSNSGSFTRAKRFSTPMNGLQNQIYMTSLHFHRELSKKSDQRLRNAPGIEPTTSFFVSQRDA